MRKSFFLSILAVGALVAGCAKSEVVDTKFNEAISFENYVGRDAMTRAAITGKDELETVGAEIGLYGYYTGKDPWKIGDQATGMDNPTANLWANGVLKFGPSAEGAENSWYTTDTKYWTNSTDWYSFLAYAPKATTDNGISVGTENNASQTITYACPVTEGMLATNVDLLYAQVFNTHKVATVPLTFKHALSRVTVKASANGNAFGFDVKEVTLSGNYCTTGKFTLATAAWEATPASATYEFYKDHNACTYTEADGKKTWDVLGSTAVDYAGTDNYLMMIPTEFAGTLQVVYTSIYADQESNEMTKEIPVAINFVKGQAYSLNIVFEPVLDEIKFSVDVTSWDESQADYNNALGNPEDDANNAWETPTPAPAPQE